MLTRLFPLFPELNLDNKCQIRNFDGRRPQNHVCDKKAIRRIYYMTMGLERNTVNHYRLPVPENLLERIDKTSSPAHVGKLRNAIDFIVPENTPVLAAANGIVTYVKDDSNIGGPNPAYWNYTNFIVIMHANGEYSRYDHLAHRSSRVKVDQTITNGHVIAEVGMTGYTFIPHLHFQVFIYTGTNIWMDFDTVSVQDFG